MTTPNPPACEIPSGPLRDYERAKFELADILRAISITSTRLLGKTTDSALQEQIRTLFTRLAEDRFVLLVAGRFSRGKTTLMNAILGTDRLPTGLLPLTSVITSVAYGSAERVQIEYETGGIPQNVQMEDLADYITERGNPGNSRRIRRAQVELPSEILRRGFHFVDSPGLGSAIPENSRTTEAFFPEADAVIVVSGFDGPLSEEEVDAIRIFRESGRPVFIVLNKQDGVSIHARAEVLAFVREKLTTAFSSEPTRVFPLSARDGLAARLAGNREAFEASGVADFERSLVRFLIGEKRTSLVSGLCSRVARLLDQSGRDVEDGALRARLERLCAQWGGATTLGAQSAPVSILGSRVTACGLCTRVHDALYEFLRKYQHELIGRADVRERLAARHGMCGPHLWFYAAMSVDRDICLALTPTVREVAGTLWGVAESCRGDAHSAEERHAPVTTACELCAIQRQVESSAVQEILGQRSIDRGPSVCVPHLRSIIREAFYGSLDPASRQSVETMIDAMLRNQAAAAERLAEDMERYVLKRDGTRRSLVTDEEAQAAQRALAFLAGRRHMAFHD